MSKNGKSNCRRPGVLIVARHRGQYTEYRTGERPGNPCLDPPNPNANLYVFPYDWRRDNAEAASGLNGFIACVLNDHPQGDGKVDILTHSMGGLVAVRYVSEHQSNHHVGRLVTIAAPWLGAPKAIRVLETGGFMDKWWEQLLTNEIFRNLSRNYRSVHQLLPTRKYFEIGGRPLIQNKLIGPDVVIQDYDEFVRIMDERFAGSRPGTINKDFHDNPPQDDGSRLPGDVKYYHFYGVTDRKDTVISVKVPSVCIPLGLTGLTVTWCFNQDTKGFGDGTVPEISAKRIPSLNASGASICPFRDDNNPDVVNHTNLVHNYSVLSSALLALGSNSQIACNNLFGTSRATALEAQTLSAAYYVTLVGAESIKVFDSAGNNTEALSDPSDAGLPNISTFKTGDASADLVIPMTQTYTVTFRPAGPMYVQITREADLPDQAVRYQDLTLPAGVTARIRLTPQGIENLNYDSDGDGVFETSVTPTTSVTGTAAQDIEAPVVTISENSQSECDGCDGKCHGFCVGRQEDQLLT